MRLGGPVFGEWDGPEAWAELVKGEGYRAAFCPVQPSTDDATVVAFADAARAADIVIAEVGAWSNPISPNDEEREAALTKNREALALADRIGACCCVNISGSRSAECWHGPCAEDLTPETFDLIVETVRGIIDEVKPTRTRYTLETMQWSYPDSADNYLALVKAIDREQFAVHLDPTNLIHSPHRYFTTADIIRDAFEKLGPQIKSCHAKDISLSTKLTVHLDEVRPGLGALDYHVFLAELNKLDPDIPLMIEHLPDAEEYRLAAGHIRSVAGEVGASL